MMPSPASSSSLSLSLGVVVQYAFLAVLAYVLAGAPLLSIVSPSASSTTSRNSAARFEAASSNAPSPDKLESLVIPEKNLSCKPHSYGGVHVLARDPLVVYIEGFLSDEEVSHVVQISEPKFTPSTVWTSGTERLDPSVRLSEKAPVDRDQTVKCIEDRARAFQGWRPHVFVEKLWAQRYGVGGHYTYHYDWSSATTVSGRVSSFMVYLGANCTGGGTHFPRLEVPDDLKKGEWCRFVECNQDGLEDDGEERRPTTGVTFKPVRGNAVFWENMRTDGSGMGYRESWHAGLAVESGEKIGLNIWSWWQDGYVP